MGGTGHEVNHRPASVGRRTAALVRSGGGDRFTRRLQRFRGGFEHEFSVRQGQLLAVALEVSQGRHHDFIESVLQGRLFGARHDDLPRCSSRLRTSNR